MREKGTFTKDISNIGYFEAKEQFLGGNAAMINSGAWDIGDFEGSDIASKIGFFWGPTFPTASMSSRSESRHPAVFM